MQGDDSKGGQGRGGSNSAQLFARATPFGSAPWRRQHCGEAAAWLTSTCLWQSDWSGCGTRTLGNGPAKLPRTFFRVRRLAGWCRDAVCVRPSSEALLE